MTGFEFNCESCGQRHIGVPALAFEAPIYWNEVEALGRPETHVLSSDLCVIADEHHFIRCSLDMPIRDVPAVLSWSIWMSQSNSNFETYRDTLGDTPEQVTFGYLANRLPEYPDTLNLRAQVRWRARGERPIVELEPVEHPLFADWTAGLTRDRAIAFAQLVLHPT
ncbi:DUF2199 domain-containing protein [Sphingomonas sp. BK235]|uniref:DUF2199 domain-containing protein n=1 Tax=Sphingomonas sp. BK235 TaxID=2512131 RepID=UPI001052B441|nr:DUF2199 domain-containing protein [Sphingomonas sp. BK235]